jgi:hypothetical protein
MLIALYESDTGDALAAHDLNTGYSSTAVADLMYCCAAVNAVAVQSKAGAKVAAELNLTPGESELIKATRSHGCCFRAEVSCSY